MDKKKYHYDQETVEKYQKTIKENNKRSRINYQKAKNTRSLQNRKMYFLREILDCLKISNKDIITKTGISQQRLSWWFVVDDIQYTTLQKMFKLLGYTIEAEYEIQQEVFKPKNYQIQINDEIITNKISPKSFIEKQKNKNAPSKFIVELIDSYGYTLKQFCLNYNINYNNCYSWIRLSNFKVSHIYMLSELTNSKVKWKVHKIEE